MSDTEALSEDTASLFSGENGAWVEALYEDFILGRAEVPENWRLVFESLSPAGSVSHSSVRTAPNGETNPDLGAQSARTDAPNQNTGVVALVNAYRTHGHLIADLDPLGRRNQSEHPLLDPAEFGLSNEQMDRPTSFTGFHGLQDGTVGELLSALRHTFCGTFAVEFTEMREKERRDWLAERMEPTQNHPAFSNEERRRLLSQVVNAERFEQFLHKRFLGQKRFSLEGGESLIAVLDTIIEDGCELGCEEVVIAMAHRGRLNVMAHTMGMPYRAIMADFQASLMPANAQGAGDVKYHRSYSTDRRTRCGRGIHLSLCPNPSHLEWINPVAEGMVRAKQNFRGDTERKSVIPVQIHGDSAFTGQGIVPETLALSELDNFWTGGTVHLIVNNQIGFTTLPEDYRFTRHPSDMAKVIQAPVFHVNADDPEACVHAAKLAIEFRQRFREDVIIDMVCYRRHGHNEGDDPSYTQPLLYQQIRKHPTIARTYTDRLMRDGVVDQSSVEKLEEEQNQRLENAQEESSIHVQLEGSEGYHGLWSALEQDAEPVEGPTQVSREVVDSVGKALSSFPEGFTPHPKIKKMLLQRSEAIAAGRGIDWGAGEALAFGSLLMEGTTIRLTGQDAERGTFGHRHAVVHDVENGDHHLSIKKLAANKARFIICNSMLSEAAVLGFEYGYSTVDPGRLVVWEAQFGDFANTAQPIIDQFIASGEKKWSRSSGLVMLLPHGYEGQGPEHSSARPERFLQLCAEDNIQVVNLTTPAQYFHALRRQIHRSIRKPLIVMSPKSLLRHPAASSKAEEFTHGSFSRVIDDPAYEPGGRDPQETRRVVLCTGKVFYSLLTAREDSGFEDVALIRVEQLNPFPFDEIEHVLSRYSARDVIWVQEEPWNMGYWSFVHERLLRALPKGKRIRYTGAQESASPATGSYRIHEEQQAEFIREAFAKRQRKKV
ncbi:MAG: 2-oxoglutarate dehydrogenase E1 component [bacterium]|nr:2-oxoglutarate dehydrogenase E1 component [bacterium]